MRYRDFFLKLSSENRYMETESAKEFYYSILRVILKEVKENGSCSCPDFGKFETVVLKGTRHRDVNTGLLTYKEPVKVIKFRPCIKLKRYIKNK